MIVSASYRTDIPAFYADWFETRLRAGHVDVANPYGGRPYRVSLHPQDVTAYVFWSRNFTPFTRALERVHGQGVPFMLQFTATGYPRPLESSTIPADAAIEQLRSLAGRYGPRAAVWRYDPVLLSSLTRPDWHRENFARLAGALEGVVDEVVLSFAQIYRKTRSNLDASARKHGFSWFDPDPEQKSALLGALAEIAGNHSMIATVCSQPELGGQGAACIDIARLSDIADAPLKARQKGNRPGCLCAESRDIGAYDSCPHGCSYCYAVRDRDLAAANYRRHDAGDDFLLPAPQAR